MTEITENTRIKIYQGLKSHYGAIKSLAEKANCSTEWVRLVVGTGEENDPDLLEAAAEFWLELEVKKKAKLSRASSFADEAFRMAQMA